MVYGTASLLFIAEQNPTIGVASVIVSPLNPSSVLNKSLISLELNVAGMLSPEYAGKAICPTMTAFEPKSINS